MAQPELSLVFPLYNEAENVCQVIPPIAEILETAGVKYELVLVDNGSSDDTAQLIQQLADENPRIKIVIVDINQGYGWGIICGLKHAAGDCLGFMGSDGQIDPKDIVHVYNCVRNKKSDLAKVVRISRHDGLARKLNSLAYNRLFRMLFNIDFRDINGSPKIFSRQLLNKLDVSSRDWFLDAEIMIKSKLLGVDISEVTIAFLPRAGGESHVKISSIFEFLRNMFYYRWGGGLTHWKESRL